MTMPSVHVGLPRAFHNLHFTTLFKGKCFRLTHSLIYSSMHYGEVHNMHPHVLKYCEISYLRELFTFQSLHISKMYNYIVFERLRLTFF